MIGTEGFTFCAYFIENLGVSAGISKVRKKERNLPMTEDATELFNINLREELLKYNVDGKWNDYVGLQKRIVGSLKEEGYFENNDVVNKESGMLIRITTKGIKETLGKGKRFQNLPKIVKQLKVATLRYLPQIIENGNVLEDNVPNVHGENALFAYIYKNVKIDNGVYGVRIAVKQRIGDNIFWIHNIDCKEISPELLDLRSIGIGN